MNTGLDQFSDQRQRIAFEVVRVTLWVVMLTFCVSMLIFLVSDPPPGADLHARWVRIGLSALVPLCATIGLALLSRHLLVPAVALFSSILYVVPMTSAIGLGLGVHSIGMALWPVVVMLLGFAWGRLVAGGAALLFVVSIFGLMLAQLGGSLPGPSLATLGGPIFFATVLILLLVLTCWLTIRYSSIFFSALSMTVAAREEVEHSNLALQRSEESLQLRSRQFEAILTATTESIFHVDREGIILAINATAARRMQMAPDELVGSCIFDFFPPDVAATRRADMTEALATGRMQYNEDMHDDRYFALNYYPISSPHGGAESLVVFALDITERKLVEEELKRSAERFRCLSEMSSDFYWESDAEHRLTQRTESRREIEEAVFHERSSIGKRRWEIAYLSPNEAGWAEHRRLLDAHLPFRDFEIARPRANGAVHHISISGDPVFDDAGQFMGYHGVGTDITERCNVQLRLAQNEERMELAIAGADLGLWDLDIPSGIFTHNPRLITMVGYEPGEIQATAKTFVSLLHPDDAGRFGSAFYAHLKGDTSSFEAEYRVRHRDDHWVWILSRGKVVQRDQEGRAVRMTGTNRDISESKRSEAALKAREARLATLIASMQDLVFVLDTGGTVVEYFYPTISRHPAYQRREDVLNKTYAEIFPADVARSMDDAVAGIMGDGRPRTFEYATMIGGKESISVATMSPLVGESRYPTGFLVVVHDITTERTSLRELERLSRSNTLLLESVGEGIYGVDLAGRTSFVNSSALAMLGYKEAEVLGQEPHTLFHHRRQDGSPYPFDECPIKGTLQDGRIRHAENEWFWRKDGGSFPVALTVTPIVEHDQRAGVVVVFQDITERKASEAMITDLAFYDPLTHLPNRRLLLDRLEQAMAASQRSECHSALMFLDLDNFKPLNDAHGHVVGDLLLVEAANRLKSCVREADTVARFGGDEFVVILSELSGDKASATAHAEFVAEKICRTLAEPYLLTVKRETAANTSIVHSCTASIGVALFIGHEISQDVILMQADHAMYEAKEAGRNRFRFASAMQPADSGEQRVTANFMQLAWHPAYQSGNALIDEQHRALMSDTNRLHTAILSRRTTEEVATLIKVLLSKVITHFRDEEALIAAAGFPGAAEHATIHRELVDRAGKLVNRFHAGSLGIGELFAFLADDVIARHMLETDRKFFPYLARQLESQRVAED